MYIYEWTEDRHNEHDGFMSVYNPNDKVESDYTGVHATYEEYYEN